MKLQLRDYQEETLARSAAAEERGIRAQLWVAATGLGKTVMFAALAERRGKRALVLAHRDELIAQGAAKVLEVWPELGATDTVLALLLASGDEHLVRLARTVERNPNGVGIVKAEANDVRAQVVVASVQTLSRPKRLAELTAPYTAGWSMLGEAEPFDLVVVDEAHHATADTYGRVLDALGAGIEVCECGHARAAHRAVDEGGSTRSIECSGGIEADPGCSCMAPAYTQGPLLIGVTATPDRGDGKGLDARFSEIVACWDLLWGIRSGYLSDLRGVRVKLDGLDMAKVKVTAGDYNQGQSGAALQAANAPAAIVRAWLADHTLDDGEVVTARDRKTLVFTPTVAVAEEVAAEFVGAGIRARWVSGDTPLEDRRRILREFRDGDLMVLANCAVLTEGYDEPTVQCIVQARPTKSRALYTQMIGRGTRRHPEKDNCLVLDVVGSSAEHSLVTVPSLFGIDVKVRPYKDGESLAGAIQEQERELVRLGRLRAEEADLFAKVRREGLAWVAIHRDGDELRRFVLSLGARQLPDGSKETLPLVVLAQRVAAEDVWTAGLQWPDGRKQVLLAEVAMETAQAVAEDYVRKEAPAASKLTDANAAWRKGRPSKKALEAAGKWHLVVDKSWNAGQLSDAMNAHIARIKSKPKRPAAKP